MLPFNVVFTSDGACSHCYKNQGRGNMIVTSYQVNLMIFPFNWVAGVTSSSAVSSLASFSSSSMVSRRLLTGRKQVLTGFNKFERVWTGLNWSERVWRGLDWSEQVWTGSIMVATFEEDWSGQTSWSCSGPWVFSVAYTSWLGFAWVFKNKLVRPIA